MGAGSIRETWFWRVGADMGDNGWTKNARDHRWAMGPVGGSQVSLMSSAKQQSQDKVEGGPGAGGLDWSEYHSPRGWVRLVSAERGPQGPGGPRPSPRSFWSPSCPTSGRSAQSPPPCPSPPRWRRVAPVEPPGPTSAAAA